MTNGGARLTPLGKLLSIVMIIGIIGLGVFLVMRQNLRTGPTPGEFAGGGPETEAPDLTGVTTVKEYKYVPGDRLPEVKGVSQYRWDEKERVLRFSYNVWAGWLPVMAANRGTKANAESVFAKKHGFRV
ncbi:MAG: hypothetical protein FJW35_18555, partial [Acidobacteria bacterium]|nr:hypothetical protein [Acidobacteriota bacterium]